MYVKELDENKMKILANDGIDAVAIKLLENAGFTVDTTHIPQDELSVKLQEYDVITVRSATKVRKDLIDACPNLKVIGRGGDRKSTRLNSSHTNRYLVCRLLLEKIFF